MGHRLTPGQGRWRTVAASVQGAGHRSRAVECQDASAIDVVDGVLLLAVADGAGSAPRAAEGSSLAVEAAMSHLRERARSIASCPLSIFETLLQSRAAMTDDLAERATTLLVAAVTDEVVATAQIGDGAVVIRRHGQLEVPAPVSRGEYLNETCFLTSDRWLAEARTAVVPAAGVDAIAATTDGLELVAFDFASGTPHEPFFTPLFAFAAGNSAEDAASSAADGASDQLASFLGSDRVAERTDDDVTLVLAARQQ